MIRSKVVQALADLASSGSYNVNPDGARAMNRLFEIVADVINSLEAEENVPEGCIPEESSDAGN